MGLALAEEQIGIVFFSAHTLNKGGLALPGDLFNFFNVNKNYLIWFHLALAQVGVVGVSQEF